MPFAFHYAARSDVGMVRSNNEDSAYAGPHLLALADGMGGHAGGDVASSTVIAGLVSLDDEALSGRDLSEALLARILSANADIGNEVRSEPRLDGMGTTLIAMLRSGDKIVLAHIGDSRAFMVRDGVVTQVTKDHSFVQTLVDEGRITPEEAQTHPQRSLVTRVLTGSVDDEPDLVLRQGRIGDRYLLASDGLTDYVARDTIHEVLTAPGSPADCADRLVALALRAGAPDNVTVIVSDIVDGTTDSAPPTQPQVVGAAAVREKGIRPMPTTPAAKAAALTQEATRAASGSGTDEPDAGGDGVTLAEEGPRSHGGTVLRLLALIVVSAVVLAGGSYAAYAWSQQQYHLSGNDGVVTVYQGVNQTLGPISLSRPLYTTTIAVDDLPPSYESSLEQGIDVDDRAAADARVEDLRLQATACRWARLNGEECRTVPSTWTPPSPTPTLTPTPSPSGTPSGTTPAPTPTTTSRGPSPTGSPVTA